MRPRIPDLRDARKRHARARAHQLWLRAARRRWAPTPGGLDPVTGGAIEVGVASAWRSNQAGRLAQQHEHEQDERRVAQAPYEAVEGPQQRTADQAAKHAHVSLLAASADARPNIGELGEIEAHNAATSCAAGAVDLEFRRRIAPPLLLAR